MIDIIIELLVEINQKLHFFLHTKCQDTNQVLFKDAVVADVTGNGDVAKVENGDVKPEVVLICQNTFRFDATFAGNQWRCCED